MLVSCLRITLLIAVTLFATSACHGSSALPPGAPPAAGAPVALLAGDSALAPADTTSILRKLTKDVLIGSTIVANTHGKANMLVELTPAGKVLDTKVVDTKDKQGVFGLAAAGSNGADTVLFYTDTNDNAVHELEH